MDHSRQSTWVQFEIISSEQHRSGVAAPAAAAAAASSQHKNVCLQDFLLGFYARRLKRLQPALVFVLCATAVGLALLVPEDFYSTDLYWGTLGFGLVGMANVWLSTLPKRSEVVQQENVARAEAAPRTVIGPDATTTSLDDHDSWLREESLAWTSHDHCGYINLPR